MTITETNPIIPSSVRRGGRKLAIICSKGNLDMAHPGDLKFTMLGNTATHLPQGLVGLPGMTSMATHQMKTSIAEIGARGPGVPAADRRLGRPPVGPPDVRGHAAPGGRGPL